MLDEALHRLATGRNFAAVSTSLGDGRIQTQVMWIDSDGDHLIVNTQVDRQKYRNVIRDPNVTVTIWDAADPYFYIEARGRVTDTVTGARAREHIDDLCRHYLGHDYDPGAISAERVMLLVTPDRIVSR